MMPDYENMESINRLPTQASTWTVDRDGYVYASARGITRTSYYTQFYVNGKCASCIPNWDYDTAETTVVVVPVSKGDIVNFNAGNYASQYYTCYFIPPKFTVIPNPTIVVEPGSDYSTDEQPVMIKDVVTGEIRQKLDVDGSPIWERTFVGTITSAANTGLNTNVGGVPIKNYVSVCGSWNTNSANPSSVAAIPYAITTYQAGVGTYTGGTPLLYTISAYARTDAPYRLTIQYTKL
jgi:hypothetical protein